MSDSIIQVPTGITLMGTDSAPAAAPSVTPSSAPVASPAVSVQINDNSVRGSAGNNDTVPTINAADAEHQHRLIQRQLDAVDAKLAAHAFDPKTGARRDAYTGREREGLEQQRKTLHDAFAYQATLATRELPKVAERADAQRQEQLSLAAREARITKLSEMPGRDGKPIGRIAALDIVRRAEINALVG